MSATQDMLHALLKVAKLTQVEISRRTGIPQPRLSRWSTGEPPEAADDALKLHQLHAELIGADGAPPAVDASAGQVEASHAA